MKLYQYKIFSLTVLAIFVGCQGISEQNNYDPCSAVQTWSSPSGHIEVGTKYNYPYSIITPNSNDVHIEIRPPVSFISVKNDTVFMTPEKKDIGNYKTSINAIDQDGKMCILQTIDFDVNDSRYCNFAPLVINNKWLYNITVQKGYYSGSSSSKTTGTRLIEIIGKMGVRWITRITDSLETINKIKDSVWDSTLITSYNDTIIDSVGIQCEGFSLFPNSDCLRSDLLKFDSDSIIYSTTNLPANKNVSFHINQSSPAFFVNCEFLRSVGLILANSSFSGNTYYYSATITLQKSYLASY